MAQLHVVVVPVAVYGHIFPMLQFSVQLASLGNKVSFIMSGRTLERTKLALDGALRQESDPVGIRSRLKFQVLSNQGGVENQEELEQLGGPGIVANLIWMWNRIPQIEELIDRSVEEQGAPSFLVLDFLLMQLRGAGEKHGVSSIPFWTPSPAYLIIIINLQQLLDAGLLEFSDRIIQGIPGLPELCVYKDMPNILLGRSRLDLHAFFSVAEQVRQAPCVVMNTIEKLDSEALGSIRSSGVEVVSVGPVISAPSPPLEGDENEAAILRFLDSKPPASVIYICFGSFGTRSWEQMKELACALELSTGYNFLWVLRGEVDESFMESFKVKNQMRGLIVSWCCQIRVLRHAAVGGFVTHCGWNSMLEGVSSGVPMVGWPCIAEQKTNSKFLADVWKVGGIRIVDIEPDGSTRLVGRDEIAQALSKIMSPDSLARALAAKEMIEFPKPMVWLRSICKAVL